MAEPGIHPQCNHRYHQTISVEDLFVLIKQFEPSLRLYISFLFVLFFQLSLQQQEQCEAETSLLLSQTHLHSPSSSCSMRSTGDPMQRYGQIMGKPSHMVHLLQPNFPRQVSCLAFKLFWADCRPKLKVPLATRARPPGGKAWLRRSDIILVRVRTCFYPKV